MRKAYYGELHLNLPSGFVTDKSIRFARPLSFEKKIDPCQLGQIWGSMIMSQNKSQKEKNTRSLVIKVNTCLTNMGKSVLPDIFQEI